MTIFINEQPLRRVADEQHALRGCGDGHGVGPGEGADEGARGFDLGGANEQGEATAGGRELLEEFDGGGENLVETFDGAQGDGHRICNLQFVICNLAGVGLGANGADFYAGELEGADDLAQKRGFALVGFQQRRTERGRPDLDGEAGETGAGTDIQQVPVASRQAAERIQMAGGKEGFAEVASDDLFGIADGGEVDARVPAQEEVEIAGELRQLRVAEGSAAEKRGEQGGDAGGLHCDQFRVSGGEKASKFSRAQGRKSISDC